MPWRSYDELGATYNSEAGGWPSRRVGGFNAWWKEMVRFIVVLFYFPFRFSISLFDETNKDFYFAWKCFDSSLGIKTDEYHFMESNWKMYLYFCLFVYLQRNHWKRRPDASRHTQCTGCNKSRHIHRAKWYGTITFRFIGSFDTKQHRFRTR